MKNRASISFIFIETSGYEAWEYAAKRSINSCSQPKLCTPMRS